MTALSIVVPCFNEEPCLAELHQRLSAAAHLAAGEDYELVLVNDDQLRAAMRLIFRGAKLAVEPAGAAATAALCGPLREVSCFQPWKSRRVCSLRSTFAACPSFTQARETRRAGLSSVSAHLPSCKVR